jgi:phage terminase large subunit
VSTPKSAKRITTGYTPRPLQEQLHREMKRFSVVVAHRRFGKTTFSINHVIHKALGCDHKNPQYAYIAPLYGQAKRVAWVPLKEFALKIPGATVNEADLRVDIPRPHKGDFIRIMLLGAENPDALRGIYLDGCVLDEFADMNPLVWTEIIRPALSDRLGWAIFIGTPKGRNTFFDMYEQARHDSTGFWYAAIFKASETSIIPESELQSLRREMSEDSYAQELECSFAAGMVGAYYARELENARKEGRVGIVAYDPALPVDTFWDLGVNDTTCIWFMQRSGPRWHAIDYLEEHSLSLAQYVRKLQERPYVYGRHTLPHDVRARDLSTGKTREEVLRSLGLRAHVLPRLEIADGIHAARMILPRVWFNFETTKRGLECLEKYQRKYDPKNQIFSDTPLHNQYSNGADSFRYFALGAQEESPVEESSLPRQAQQDYDLFAHG